ncbi:MAG: SDR family oxidoreductase [Parvibaculaceae bacterium]
MPATDMPVAVVTGGGSGIGRAIALLLAEEGYRVVVCGRRQAVLDEVVRNAKGEMLAVVLDISRTDAEILPLLPEAWRSIDVLVNNAGSDIGGRRPYHTGSMEDWRGTIETNVIGLMQVTREILPGMSERGHGHIVNIGSSVAHRSYPGSVAYATSKAAVHMLTDCLRAEHLGSGIRITEIMPGVVRTDFDKARKFGDENAAKTFYDGFGSVLAPDDIARSVLFALRQPPGVVIAQMTILPTSDW